MERLINRSRMIGSDPEMVLYGGGNTSSKIVETAPSGEVRTVLRVKGSGSDLRTVTMNDFPGLYLDDLLKLRDRASMSDEEMVDCLATCMVDPAARRPSIETLLHAFLPFDHVDHVHADAICALTNHPDGENAVKEALGEDVAFVPYLRPGFELSKRVGGLSGARAVVLAHHGLVTWGRTPEESYGLTLELVDRANRYLDGKTAGRRKPSQPLRLSEKEIDELLVKVRGLLSGRRPAVLHADFSQLPVANRTDVEQIASGGRGTLEHILRIGPATAVVPSAEKAASCLTAFVNDYVAYYTEHLDRLPSGVESHDPLPKVLLAPGLGCITSGPTKQIARMRAEIASHTHAIAAKTIDAFGSLRTLSRQDVFDVDYWPLELYKLTLSPPPPELSGFVALAANVPDTLAEQFVADLTALGAHLVLLDTDQAKLDRLQTLRPDQVVAVCGNSADPSVIWQCVRLAIRTYGGMDGAILQSEDPGRDEAFEQVGNLCILQGTNGTFIAIDVHESPEAAEVVARIVNSSKQS